MKTFSIISIALFALFTLTTITTMAELEPVLDGLDSLGSFASLFDSTNKLEEISDSVYSLMGCALFGNLLGLALSITMYLKSKKLNDSNSSDMTKLQELNTLRQSGALTESEFETKKRELLNY